MAVRNEYIDSTVASGKKGLALDVGAAGVYKGVATFEIAAGDEDGSIFRLFKGVDPNLILVSLRVACDVITGGTDYDVGLYDSLEEGGLVIDANCFADGLNPSAGYSRILGLDGLVSVDLADVRKRIFEIAGHTLTTRRVSYDICITANTIGTAGGTMSVFAEFVQG